MRICSLLPSATEVLYELGLGDNVVGVTHECDYPPEARAKPVLVHPRVDPSASPGEVDRQVREFTGRGESLYTVDFEGLRAVAPDLIFTQDLCHVCAASPGDLGGALAQLPNPPRVITLAPRTLADVWNDIRKMGQATGRPRQGEALAAVLERRVEVVESVVGDTRHSRALCLEWLDPPYVAGHWVPEMVAWAGGLDVLGRAGEPSFPVAWADLLATQPDFVLVMPCGYGVERAVKEYQAAGFPAGWLELPAVRDDRVFAVDANSYFSRPGPRLAHGVELLAGLFHPARARWEIPAGAVRQVHRAASAQGL